MIDFALLRRASVDALSATRAGATLFALGFASFAPGAAAAEWPQRPVSFVVPFSPGGNTDTMARLLAQKMSVKFGQPFLVENKVGASGTIATSYMARSAPDGYTFMFGAAQHLSVVPYVEKVTYDAKSLTPVSIFGEGPFVLGIRGSTPAKTLAEFVDYVKKQPDGASSMVRAASPRCLTSPPLC